MSLREKWYRFKSRAPGPLYSYVWWETILSFVWTGIVITCFLMAVALRCWILLALGVCFIPIDYWWSRREIRGRAKYRIFLPEVTEESFYHFECDCGANFPVEENMISDTEVRCPACKKEWNFKDEQS